MGPIGTGCRSAPVRLRRERGAWRDVARGNAECAARGAGSRGGIRREEASARAVGYVAGAVARFASATLRGAAHVLVPWLQVFRVQGAPSAFARAKLYEQEGQSTVKEGAVARKTRSTKEAIRAAAYDLLLRQGYAATSFSCIAEQAGVSKSLVQRHLHKKEAIMVDFLRDLLDAADEYLSQRERKTDNYWANLHLIGQIHYAFLLKDEGRRTLMLDILSDRALTEHMISLDTQWAFGYMHTFTDEQKDQLEEDMAMTMAGTYELLYRALVRNRSLDIEGFQRKSLNLTMHMQGMDQGEIDRLLAEGLLSHEEREAGVDFIEARLTDA